MMTVRNNTAEVLCTSVGPHSKVAAVINKAFPVGISEEEGLIIILYRVGVQFFVTHKPGFPVLHYLSESAQVHVH